MKRVALFVGINTYESAPLSCAKQDAKTLYKLFKERYDDVVLLTDKQASGEKILDTLESLRKKARSGDMFLFYFSGHGCEYDGRRFISVPQCDADGEVEGVNIIATDSIAEVTNKVGLHRLFVLDCCRGRLPEAEKLARKSCRPKFAGYMQRHRKNKAILPIILSSSAPGENSYEDLAHGMGYFTRAFKTALLDSEVNNFNDFRAKLDDEMLSYDMVASQRPYFEGGIGSDLPFWPGWAIGVTDNVRPGKKRKERKDPRDETYYDVDAEPVVIPPPQIQHHSGAPAINVKSREILPGDVLDVLGDVDRVFVHLGANIPQWQRLTAHKAMCIRCNPKNILAICDNCRGANGHTGFAIARDGLYMKNKATGKPFFMKWGTAELFDRHGMQIQVNGFTVAMRECSIATVRKMFRSLIVLEEKCAGRHFVVKETVDCQKTDSDDTNMCAETMEGHEMPIASSPYSGRTRDKLIRCECNRPSRGDWKMYLAGRSLGSGFSSHQIATMYRYGIGVAVDFKKWLDYTLEAIERGCQFAAYDLALAYEYGDYGLTIDPGRALFYCKRAAELGNCLACSYLNNNKISFKGNDSLLTVCGNYKIVSRSNIELFGDVVSGEIHCGERIAIIDCGRQIGTGTIIIVRKNGKRVAKAVVDDAIKISVLLDGEFVFDKDVPHNIIVRKA